LALQFREVFAFSIANGTLPQLVCATNEDVRFSMRNIQLSLFEQARGANPDWADADVIRRVCEDILEETLSEPPVNPALLASMRGIARIEERNQPWAGVLTTEGAHFVVGVRASDSYARRRFTVLHETGHTLLPGFADQARYRCNGATTPEEQLCGLAASEFLFPRKFFTDDLAKAGFSTRGVEFLADRYHASIEATAIRAVELAPHDALLIALRVGIKPTEQHLAAPGAPTLRVAWSFGQGEWGYVRRHKSVESESVFARAFDGEIVDEDGMLGSVCVYPDAVRLSVRRFGSEVLALVRPTRNREDNR
jgi:IrrE N-terminal-like domain